MISGFGFHLRFQTQNPVGMSCPCPARSRVQQLCTVRYKATTEGLCVRTVQKMQNEAGVQFGMLPILKARGKSCMKLPHGSYSGHILNRMCVSCREHTEKDDPSVTCCLYHVLSNGPDFKSQKSWLSENVKKYPGCQLI